MYMYLYIQLLKYYYFVFISLVICSFVYLLYVGDTSGGVRGGGEEDRQPKDKGGKQVEH